MPKKSISELHFLEGQPGDQELLSLSNLYRKSRFLFLKQGGAFVPNMLSSARSLGSSSLLENAIEYSPVASEIHWALSDRIQKKEKEWIYSLREWITGVYHEQNHRILWNFLNQLGYCCPSDKKAAGRYLNLTESLVIILDMSLADSLGFKIAQECYDSRIIYNPGNRILEKYFPKESNKNKPIKKGSRTYRNILQVCLHTTFLRLEGMHISDIPENIRECFINMDSQIVDESIKRALKIEPLFVELTNPIWQKKNLKKVIEKKGRQNQRQNELILPYREPLNNLTAYSIAESWMDLFGI